MKNKHSILFSLEDDALIVANTGEPFSRKGVISICSMDLSNKDPNESHTPEDDYPESDNTLVDAVLEKRLNVYGTDINQFKEDVNREARVARDYDGRFVWELLQNADDAAYAARENARLIGAKGIGFKSVLEITEEPEIYSGGFDFHFSRDKSRKKLKQALGERDDEQEIPVCRLPHAKTRDEKVQKLRDAGYATVIRLPLRADEKDAVKNKLDEFCTSSLLFCQHIEAVEIQSNGDVRHIHVYRSEDGRTIELRDNGKHECWRVWRKQKDAGSEKQLSVSVCLPVIDQKVRHCEEVPALSVFFPTEEKVAGVHALVHVSCELDGNRKHLASKQDHGKEICKMLADITENILRDRDIPTSAKLAAFGRAEKIESGNEAMAAQLEDSISAAVENTEFVPVIGGGRVKPGDARLWKYGVGDVLDPGKDEVGAENLCKPKVNAASAEILDQLGAKFLSHIELAEILRFCRNETEQECLAALEVAQSLMAESNRGDTDLCKALRKAPFWRTREGHAHALIGDVPLVEKNLKDCPEWLPVNVVSESFLSRAQKAIKNNADGKNFLRDGDVWPLQSKREYFDHILLPYCEKQSLAGWKEKGWEILKMARKWQWGDAGGSEKVLIIGSGTKEETRAKIIHVPVGKGADNWAPAWQCYAGAEWDGPKMFDYFAGIEDRFVLSPLKCWKVDGAEEKKEEWKVLLSWLGCAWAPILFQQRTIHSGHDWIPQPRGDELDFHFEFFPEVLSCAQPPDHAALLKMGHVMYGRAKTSRARFGRRVHYADSWALEQLRKKAWVPCKSSLFHPGKRFFTPNDAYLPNRSMGGSFPEVDMRGLDKSKDAIMETLKELGVNPCIPGDPEKLVGYMSQLSKSAEREDMNLWWKKGKDAAKGKIAHAAWAIFAAYGEISAPRALHESVMVPCLRQKGGGVEIYFEQAGKVCWADASYFEEPEVRREILKKKELHVFFRFLRDGENFGLRPLSEFLEMQPGYGEELPNEAERMRERYEYRRLGITQAIRFGITEAIGAKLPEELHVVAYDNITLRSSVSSGIAAEVKFWTENGTVLVNAGRNQNMWKSLAAALGKVSNCPAPQLGMCKLAFETLLSEDKWDGFIARLRDDFNLSEDSLDEVQEIAPVESDRIEIPEPDVKQRREHDSEHSADRSLQRDTPRDREESQHEVGSSAGEGNAGMPHRPESAEIPKLEAVQRKDRMASNRRGGGRPGSGGGSRSHHESKAEEKGSRGEQALLQWLCAEYGDDCVFDKNEPNRNNPGYDILVKTATGEDLYHECKSFTQATQPPSVELTETQFALAKQKGKRYVLCVIYDLNANPAKMLRICDPAALESDPTRYRVYLASRSGRTET